MIPTDRYCHSGPSNGDNSVLTKLSVMPFVIGGRIPSTLSYPKRATKVWQLKFFWSMINWTLRFAQVPKKMLSKRQHVVTTLPILNQKRVYVTSIHKSAVGNLYMHLKVPATIPYFNFHFFPHLPIFLQFSDPYYVLNLSTKVVLQKWHI